MLVCERGGDGRLAAGTGIPSFDQSLVDRTKEERTEFFAVVNELEAGTGTDMQWSSTHTPTHTSMHTSIHLFIHPLIHTPIR